MDAVRTSVDNLHEDGLYNDKQGLEANCVIHLKNGDYALIKFKLGNKSIDHGAKNLLKLDKLIKRNTKEKKFEYERA